MSPRRLADWDDADLVGLVCRDDLPPRFERWQVPLPPGSSRPTSPEEWAGAIVLVAEGHLRVDCRVGGTHAFSAGDVLVLGWLPLQRLHNPGDDTVRLVAIRRREERAPQGLLRVIRHIRQEPDNATR